MQEIRCTNCGKLLGKIIAEPVSATIIEPGVLYRRAEGSRLVEIKCPHNYRDENGKNVQCKTLNKIII